MIKSKFTFFQVKIESTFMDSFKLGKPRLGNAPEVLDAVDVALADSKLILSVPDSLVLPVAKAHKSVVGTKAVSKDGGLLVHPVTDEGNKLIRRTVFDHLSKNLSLPFDDPKDYRFSPGSAPPDTPHPPRAKVALIDFDLAGAEHAVSLARLGNSLPDPFDNFIDRVPAEAGQTRYFAGLNIENKISQYFTEFPFRNSGTENIFVFHYKTIP